MINGMLIPVSCMEMVWNMFVPVLLITITYFYVLYWSYAYLSGRFLSIETDALTFLFIYYNVL